MEWFNEWWNTLALFEQILYCVAIPATLILLIQLIMIILGFGHDGAGINPSDTSGIEGLDGVDVSFDADTGTDFIDGGDPSDINTEIDYGDGSSHGDFGTMNFFTVQGMITLLCVFGWVGILTYNMSANAVLAVILGIVTGLAAMYGVAKLLWVSKKLAQNGTLNVRNLLGASGTVYLVIPGDGESRGKVNIASGERLVEFDAVTECGEALPDGTAVRVTDIRQGNVLVVEKI
ncbi:MAG: NfeD family protein [Clostridia bacterium]|nr:NfeD family protein [Clostridia bacterium]